MRPVRPAEDKVNTFSMFCEFFNVETMQPAQEGRYVLWISRERDGRVVHQFHVTGFWDGKSWKDDCGCEWEFDTTMEQIWWSPQLRDTKAEEEEANDECEGIGR